MFSSFTIVIHRTKLKLSSLCHRDYAQIEHKMLFFYDETRDVFEATLRF